MMGKHSKDDRRRLHAVSDSDICDTPTDGIPEQVVPTWDQGTYTATYMTFEDLDRLVQALEDDIEYRAVVHYTHPKTGYCLTCGETHVDR